MRLKSVFRELAEANLRDFEQRKRAISNAILAAITPSAYLGRGILESDKSLVIQKIEAMFGPGIVRVPFRNFDIRNVKATVARGKFGDVLGLCFATGQQQEDLLSWVRSHRLDGLYTFAEHYEIKGPGPNGQPFGYELRRLRRSPWAESSEPPFYVGAHGDTGTVTVTLPEQGEIHIDGDTFARILCAQDAYRDAIKIKRGGPENHAMNSNRPTVLVICCSAGGGEESVLRAVNQQLESEKLPSKAYGTSAVVVTKIFDRFGQDFPDGLAITSVHDVGEFAEEELDFIPKSGTADDLGEQETLTIWPAAPIATPQSLDPGAQKLLPPPRQMRD